MWLYENIFFNYQKIAAVSLLCALAIIFRYKVENCHCRGEFLNIAIDAILTHLVQSIVYKRL